MDSVYSVIFSNHTAYAKIFGSVAEESDFHELYHGLKHNRLNTYDYVVSGRWTVVGLYLISTL